MTREERVDCLIAYLKKENSGYDTLQEPYDYEGKRRLLRILMNVRFPMEISEEYVVMQDALLREEAEEKGIVELEDISPIGELYPCTTIKNVEKMSLWRGDITRLSVDAIVNAANSQLLGCFVPCHGCIDNVIHSAAGVELRNECAQIMELQGHEEPTGKAKITKGYNLPAKHVIHTVGPIWRGGNHGERQLLIACYRSSLELAVAHHCKSVAFPLISSGVYGYPKDQALKVAVETIEDFLLEHDMEVTLVIFDQETWYLAKEKFGELMDTIHIGKETYYDQ